MKMDVRTASLRQPWIIPASVVLRLTALDVAIANLLSFVDAGARSNFRNFQQLCKTDKFLRLFRGK